MLVMTDTKELDTPSAREEALSTWNEFFNKKVEAIPTEVALMSERELEKHFRPTSIDFHLRKRFWEVSTRSINSGIKETETIEIYRGICSRQHFYELVLKNPYKLLWIIMPIQAHMDIIEEGFYYALKKVRDEILTMPVNEKTAGHIMKALDFFANRAIGPVVQRIEQKNMNLNVDGNSVTRDALTPDDLQKKLDELRAKALAAPVVVDLNEPN